METAMAVAVEEPTLEITLRCASGLKKVNLVSKMDVYAVVSISAGDGDNDSIQTAKSPPDRNGGSNPAWDFPIRFDVDEEALRKDRLTLEFKLICDRALGNKDIGEVHVSVKELLDSAAVYGGLKFVSYQVTKPSGRPKGQLTFSYKFCGKPAFAATPSPSRFISSHLSSMKVCEESMAAYPAVEFKSKSIYPLMSVKVFEDSITADPSVELDSNSMYPPASAVYGGRKAVYTAVKSSNLVYPPAEPTVATAVESQSNLVYPATAKAYEKLMTAAYPGVVLDSSLLYPPPQKAHKEPAATAEFVSNSMYFPSAKAYEEPAAAEFVVPSSLYPPSTKLYEEPTAAYPAAESKSILVNPPAAEKAYGETTTAAYPTVELDSSSLYYPPRTAGRYPHIPVYPAIQAATAEGIAERDTPTTGGWYPPPSGYAYPPSEPLYVYPPAAGGYVYPPYPPASRNNKFAMQLLPGDVVV